MTVSGGVRRGPGRFHESAVLVSVLAVLACMIALARLVAVIVAGFALSFDAIRAAARASGIRADWAWLLPAAVDGAMLCSIAGRFWSGRIVGHASRYAFTQLTMPGDRARRIAIVGVSEELALPALPGDLQVDIGTSDVTG